MQYGSMFDRGQRSGSGFSTERVRWLNLNSEPRTLNPLLIRYRPFENRDPPGLAEIWRTQRPIRGRMQAVTPQVLEKHVFAKPWFDRHGLIVACDGPRLVGFAHAGFGADCQHRSV